MVCRPDLSTPDEHARLTCVYGPHAGISCSPSKQLVGVILSSIRCRAWWESRGDGSMPNLWVRSSLRLQVAGQHALGVHLIFFVCALTWQCLLFLQPLLLHVGSSAWANSSRRSRSTRRTQCWATSEARKRLPQIRRETRFSWSVATIMAVLTMQAK